MKTGYSLKMQNKMMQEVLTVKGIVNLEDVWFESVDSELYTMHGQLSNGFNVTIGVTEGLKQEIEKIIHGRNQQQ